MKVYFTASQRGRQEFDKYYKLIFNAIKEMGYEIVDDEIISIPTKEFYDELAKGGREANINLYKSNIKDLNESDINIFECSLHSLSLGFMINKSLTLNKPTIVLYLKDNVPYFVEGIDDEKFILKSYTVENIKNVLNEAFNEAKERADKRFNFFISPDLLTYLNEASKVLKITKSTFIRNLILEHKRRQKPNSVR